MTEVQTDSGLPGEIDNPELAEHELREIAQRVRQDRIEIDIPLLAAHFNNQFETAVSPELWEPEPNAGWYRAPLTTFKLLARWSSDDHVETRTVDDEPMVWHFYVQGITRRRLQQDFVRHHSDDWPQTLAHRIHTKVDLAAAIAAVDAARAEQPPKRGGILTNSISGAIIDPGEIVKPR